MTTRRTRQEDEEKDEPKEPEEAPAPKEEPVKEEEPAAVPVEAGGHVLGESGWEIKKD